MCTVAPLGQRLRASTTARDLLLQDGALAALLTQTLLLQGFAPAPAAFAPLAPPLQALGRLLPLAGFHQTPRSEPQPLAGSGELSQRAHGSFTHRCAPRAAGGTGCLSVSACEHLKDFLQEASSKVQMC